MSFRPEPVRLAQGRLRGVEESLIASERPLDSRRSLGVTACLASAFCLLAFDLASAGWHGVNGDGPIAAHTVSDKRVCQVGDSFRPSMTATNTSDRALLFPSANRQVRTANRQSLDLKTGANDVPALAPEVYFVRQASSVRRQASFVTEYVPAEQAGAARRRLELRQRGCRLSGKAGALLAHSKSGHVPSMLIASRRAVFGMRAVVIRTACLGTCRIALRIAE
jgi:hypothetical protein